MRTLLRAGVAYTAALLVIIGLGATAQAETFNPDNEPVSGIATNPTLGYGFIWVCAEGTVEGTTGEDSARIDNAVVDFFEPCTIAGEDLVVDCGDGSSTANLIAQNDTPGGGTGTVELSEDFRCVFTVPDICSITVEGPQTTQDDNLTLNEGNDTMIANMGVEATRTGSPYCGPRSDQLGISAVYHMSPTGLTIDP
jgi:hypothetical protein